MLLPNTVFAGNGEFPGKNETVADGFGEAEANSC